MSYFGALIYLICMAHFSQYLCSNADVHQFIENGYVRLPQLLTADAYRVLADAIENKFIPPNPFSAGWV